MHGAVRCFPCIEKLQEYQYAPTSFANSVPRENLCSTARDRIAQSYKTGCSASRLGLSVQNTPLPLPGTLSCSRSIRIRVVLLGHLSIENDQRVAHAAFHPADAVQESGRMHNGLALLTVNDLDAPVEEPKQLAALVVCI